MACSRHRQYGADQPGGDAGGASNLAEPVAAWRDHPPLLGEDVEPDVALVRWPQQKIATRIERQGDEYVINGRKWFITGATQELQGRDRGWA